MNHVVQLPVLYAVEGALKGKRRELLHRVVELVPAVVEDIEASGSSPISGRYEPIVAGGRPWMPVPGVGEGLASVDASSFVADVVEHRRTDTAPDLGDLDCLLARPWRALGYEPGALAIPSGADWRRSFSKVVRTDRQAAIERTVALSGRLATIDGVLHTDRYEPLGVDLDLSESHASYQAFYDLVMGVVAVPHAPGRREGPLRLAPSRNWRMEPHYDAPWARDVVWESDRTTLAALHLSTSFDYVVQDWKRWGLHHRPGRGFVDAIGHAGEGVVRSMIRWGEDRMAGNAPDIGAEELRSSIQVLRRAIATADPFSSPDEMDARLKDLDVVEAYLDAGPPVAATPSHEEDLIALSLPFYPKDERVSP